MASEGLHEAADLLDEETIDHHRAMTSLCEELEAVDWYDQRVKATSDATLAEVLAHNRDEEKEHASMTLEWLRRRDPKLDQHLRTYLFTSGSILEIEAEGRVRPGDDSGIARHRQLEGTRVMNHLHRELAPIADAGWQAIEDEIKPRLETHLAARKLVDFEGPLGWTHSATSLGRITPITGPSPDVTGSQRRVLPLVELRARFTLTRAEIDDAERGALDLDLAGLEEAGRRIALAENTAVFHGYGAGQIEGITQSTSHSPLTLSADAEHYPTAVAEAVDVLRGAGIGGPYGLALSPGIYTEIVHTAEHGGHLLLDHLRQILGGPLVWAPGVDGGIVLSLRGGDFLFESGQDISIGYLSHDAETVALYLEESFSFRVTEPDSAVALRSKTTKKA